MNPINTALYTKLNVSQLTSLLDDENTPSSIFHGQAPDGSNYPFVVFNKMSDTQLTDSAHWVANVLYQVRGFTKESAGAADLIADQIDGLLHNASLSITGFAQIRLKREGGIEFVETMPGTETVYSAGSIFRLIVEKTA
jgi:hypothetical protein